MGLMDSPLADKRRERLDPAAPDFDVALREHLCALFSSPSYIQPLLPTVALELIELSRCPDVSAKALTSSMSCDAMLAASVLRIAQSPIYSPVAPPQSLDDAVVRLGLQRVTELFFRASVESKVFRGSIGSLGDRVCATPGGRGRHCRPAA